MFCDKKIGIENIGFYTSGAYLSLRELAKNTNQDEDKFIQGIGQEKMSIITKQEDIITMGYNASIEFLNETQKNEIGLLLFATESAIDCSKSSANTLHGLLGLNKNCRCLEVKQACYGGTGALMLAIDFVKTHKDKKALVIASDVAFYGLNTSGEATQGCGAVAILISNKPNIAIFNNDNLYLTDEKNDFYRPQFQDKPIYDGHYSIKCYLQMFKTLFEKYKTNHKKIEYLITHMPFTKMFDKCSKEAKINENLDFIESVKKYNKIIGNTYTASIYIGLISLLENYAKDLTKKNIVLFSYGSGAECEIYSIKILKNYKKFLNKELHNNMLNGRIKIDYNKYVELMNYFNQREKQLNIVIENDDDNFYQNSKIKLIEIKNGIRNYEIS